jgi:dimethylargininase
VRGCLHLTSAVTEIADGVVLANPDWIDAGELVGLEVVAIDPAEPGAANVLRAGDALVAAAEHPRTRALLEARGARVHAVAAGELAKAEAGLTCCSILLRV